MSNLIRGLWGWFLSLRRRYADPEYLPLETRRVESVLCPRCGHSTHPMVVDMPCKGTHWTDEPVDEAFENEMEAFLK